MLEVEPMVDSTPLLGDAEALRRRAEEDGLLFFKGLLDRETVLGLRRLMIDVLARRGLVDPGGGPCRERVIHEAVDAQPKAEVIEQCMTVSLYNELQALEAFHALPHSPPLLELFATLFGERPLPHPRNIARVIMPGERFFPTPPHQDHPLIQGALEVWTSWIPLGDVPLALGPLALMPGSHKAGVLDTYVVPGAGGTGAKISHLPPRWVSADFEAGDIVTFSSLTVHRALPQQDRDIVRLSHRLPLSAGVEADPGAVAAAPHRLVRHLRSQQGSGASLGRHLRRLAERGPQVLLARLRPHDRAVRRRGDRLHAERADRTPRRHQGAGRRHGGTLAACKSTPDGSLGARG